ncbi:MAG TPA: urease subunit gamma [Candidatus Limnocylindrales bacterium]
MTDRETDRLLLFSAAELARRHRSAGLLLSAPEAIALMCDAMFEAARAGATYAEVEAAGYATVTPDEVMTGVPALVDEVRLEVLMDDGTRLVVLHNPLGEPDGTDSEQVAVVHASSNRERRTVSVTNTGTRAIRVSSHFPFDQVNPRLTFDRDTARGFHLDIEVGATVRWGPGETRAVKLVRRA